MKRKEFIEQVEKLGFDVRAIDLNSCKKRKKLLVTGAKGFQMGWVIESKPYSFRMEEGNEMLARLMVEYAGTPIAERETRYVIIKKAYGGTKFFLERWSTDDRSYFNIFGEITWTTTSLEKAQALATLVDGEVEEV